MIIKLKTYWPAFVGLLLLFSPALFDVLNANNTFRTRHSFLLESLVSLLNYIALTFFLTLFFRRRQNEKQKRISTVAYRTLSQSSNDVLRKLVAPLNGTNLYELGLYEGDSEVWSQNLERLKAINRFPDFLEKEGLWENVNQQYLKETLDLLLQDEQFRKQMYLIIARSRREVQSTIGIWAAVMFTSSELEQDLRRYRDIADNLELLQELWRRIGSHPIGEVDITELRNQFWNTVQCAFHIARDFALKGALPSVERELLKYAQWD